MVNYITGDIFTPDNFCAARLIIEEAGGIFTDKSGNEITTFSMRDRFNIIACATETLNKEIIQIVGPTMI